MELAVTDLGVIPELSLVLGPGMTALTGETGAGKTLVVTAIELLAGGRADASVVRPGAGEARVEGRFVAPGAGGADGEVVLTRVIPAEGRSRAYVDGRMVPVGTLGEIGEGLVDLHGQHRHQSLLGAPAQRRALDQFAGIDLEPLASARRRLGQLDREVAAFGGRAGDRSRQGELLAFEVEELDGAHLVDPAEEDALAAEEEILADALALRESAAAATVALADDAGAIDAVGRALAAVRGRGPFADIETRLAALAAEVAELGREIRQAGEAIEEDPARLDAVRQRRALLSRLRRRHQAGDLSELITLAGQKRELLAAHHRDDHRAAELENQRARAAGEVAAAAAAVGRSRREAAPRLAAATRAHLHRLAMPGAGIDIEVGGEGAGDDVRFLLAANPGEPALALSRVASGGELSRVMLALRLAIGPARAGAAGPAGTLVFDEVDAGIGGEAALAVGRALAEVATATQVLVVTHLPQVAAFADAQVAVGKGEDGGRTVASARVLGGQARVVELSRMLSGRPGSSTARDHAEELLSVAERQRGERLEVPARPGGR